MTDAIPRRRFTIAIDLHADTCDDLVAELREILQEVERRAPAAWSCTSGGYTSGYSVVVRENPAMTHDGYLEAVDAWLAGQKEAAP